jgi:molecular chaperone GrpE
MKKSDVSKHPEDQKGKKATDKRQKKQSARDLEAQVAQLTELLQRERADSENIRRRHDAQLTSLRTHVVANTVRELLPFIDNLERALQHVPNDLIDNDYVKGVDSVAKQLYAALEKLGIKRIKTVGEEFDPELHEAVSMDDSGEGTHEVVSEELQSGYMIDGHVVRHAMVNVKLQ